MDHSEGHEVDHDRNVNRTGPLNRIELGNLLKVIRPPGRESDSRYNGQLSCNENGEEVGAQLQCVVVHPAVPSWPVQRRVLDCPADHIWEETPVDWNHAFPVPSHNQQNSKDNSVSYPEHIQDLGQPQLSAHFWTEYVL